MGDSIYGLATMKNLGGGILHLNAFALKEQFVDRLFRKQEYIKETRYHRLFNTGINPEWSQLKVDYNLDLFREKCFFYKHGLVKGHAMVFDLEFDLTQPWIVAEPKRVAPIVINECIRWPGETVNWNHLRGFERETIFLGLPGEYKRFKADRKLNIEYYQVKDSYEIAQIIKGSKLFIGNQSLALSIAEALKVPRVVNIWKGNQKQYPDGEHGYSQLSSSDLIIKYLNDSLFL
jgi:hypothetical protein